MRSSEYHISYRTLAVRFALIALLASTATAYETYSGCKDCHGDFGGHGDSGSESLHGLHTGGTPMTTNCNLCHTGSGFSDPVVMWSKGDAGSPGDGLGCMGCHGRDYGETVGGDYSGFAITGKPKNSGRGLKRQHANTGNAFCITSCHTDAEPYPENVMNPGLGNTTHYYFRGDVSLGGMAMDTCINEDSANDGGGDSATPGLDNDGDGLYDRNDPDCISDGLVMTITPDGAGDLLLSWPAPAENWDLFGNTAVSPTGWTSLPAPTFRVNGRWEKTVTPGPGKGFYRLEKP